MAQRGLLLLRDHRFAQIRHDYIGARRRLIVEFSASGFQKACLHQSHIRTDNPGYMLAGLQPISVEKRYVCVGCAENDVHTLDRFPGSFDRRDLQAELWSIRLGKSAPVLRVAAENLDARYWPLTLESEQLIGGLAG